MNTNRDLNYRLYLQREEGFHRISFSSEFEKYKIISSGDVKKVRENIAGIKQNFYQGQGTLSKDPVKNVRYHLIVAVALISRVCVEVGMPFRQFIIHARVNAAKNMLAYSDFSYLEISLSLGFSSQSAFTSTFRRLTGMTPGKYREAFGDSPAEQI